MNRRILIQVTAPALLIGLLLLAACLASAWYISWLQTNLATIRWENAASLQAALELEMSVRQLRYHDFLYLGDPHPSRLEPIQKDQESFMNALGQAQVSARSPEEFDDVKRIQEGYRDYDDELARLREYVNRGGKSLNRRKRYGAKSIAARSAPYWSTCFSMPWTPCRMEDIWKSASKQLRK